MISRVSASRTTVPRGTRMIRASAVLSGALLAGTVAAVLRHVFALVAEVHQGGHLVIHLQDHIAPPAAVAPVGTAGRHVFLSVKGHRAVAASRQSEPGCGRYQ